LDTKEKDSKLSALGERKAIEVIKTILSTSDEQVAIGPGDDCAALDLGEEYLLITTDMTMELTHFPPEISPFQMGWFIVAINLSDLAAKGAKPLGVVVASGLPEDLSTYFLEDLVKGMKACATKYNTAIIGGDLKAHEHITLTGTAVGKVAKVEFMPRSGAKPGDIVAVTGTLGHAGAGFYSLKHRAGVENTDNELMEGLFEPKPRLAEGRALAKSGAVSSCMDISDGLADSLYQLAEINNIGFEIEFEKIPVDHKIVEFSKDLSIPLEDLSVYFGGDYELLMTIPPESWDHALGSVSVTGTMLTKIGWVTENTELKLIKENSMITLENRGYEHFKWKVE
jgi:thiamine-monophosphate kinase